MLGSGINLITTIIGFGISATFIVFICTRLICRRLQRRRRNEENQMLEIDSTIDLEMRPENRINGLQPVAVSGIPTMKFNRESFASMEDAQCAICLAEYQEREVLRIMPKCGHGFHLSCIDTWLRKQSTCPVCRLSVQDRTTSLSQSLDTTSHVVGENSRQWFLPISADNEGAVQAISVSEIEPRVHREATMTS